jgi:L-seryl-tRNA(Ser) seleniumtransferase
VPIGQLAELGHRYGIPVMDDVGSGALVDLSEFGLTGEPLVPESVRAGADIVTFSGDKLLGGPQAGLIVGRRDIVDAMESNPLSRALRIDKLAVAALESTLRLYAEAETLRDSLPTLRYITRPVRDIERAARRAQRTLASIAPGKLEADLIDGFSEVGGGSLPGVNLPTKLLALSSSMMKPAGLAKAFRTAEPPVFGRVGDDRFLLDLRTVEDEEIQHIVDAARRILAQ